MIEINRFLEDNINIDLNQIIISGPRKTEGPSKIKIRPVRIKNQLMFQTTFTQGAKEYHQNYVKDQLIDYICGVMECDFKQLQLEGSEIKGNVLVSKKGKMTITAKKTASEVKRNLDSLEHNRKKRYILEEGKPAPFLIELGVMNREGKVLAAKYDKFKQLNRFLEFIEDILPKLAKDREITILDFGCGKSYLTFAMYHYLKELKGYDVSIIGLDLKEDVIAECNRLAEVFHYGKLHFVQGDIASYEGVTQVDMVVTLHACDTATDFALAKAVDWGANVILSVPCCQHELNGQIENELLDPIFSYGILKERFAALLTDGLRAKILEEYGYETQVLEFIDVEHTPKNLLIRAVKKEKMGKDSCSKKSYLPCIEFLHAKPILEQLLSRQEEDTDEK